MASSISLYFSTLEQAVDAVEGINIGKSLYLTRVGEGWQLTDWNSKADDKIHICIRPDAQASDLRDWYDHLT